MTPELTISLVANLGLMAVVAGLGGGLTFGPDAIAPLALLGLIVGLATLVRLPLFFDRSTWRRGAREVWHSLRDWAPYIIVYVCYRGLVASVNLVVSHGLEAELRALDERLLGVSPSWWLDGLANPWLTELMALGYALMFPMPLVIMFALHARGRRDAFRVVGVSVLLAFYLGLLLYLVVPARSPRLVWQYPHELHGALGFYELTADAWDRLQAVTFDAFPSLHTAISTISLVWARRYGAAVWPSRPRTTFWIYLPCVILLQISTLYLRQHYFVDLVGGWTLAALVCWLAPRVSGFGRRLSVSPERRARELR
jgi:membrane-associated phospholipid phosphatase